MGARTSNGASFPRRGEHGFPVDLLDGMVIRTLVKMIVITTSGIKIKASERIMSPAVACRVVRATSYLHRARQLGCSLLAGALDAGASSLFAKRKRLSLIAPPITRGAYRRSQSIAIPAVRDTVL